MTSLPDTGHRIVFAAGGAAREHDESKPRLDLVSPFLVARIGLHMGNADVKYADVGGARNWEKGMPVTRYLGGLERHLNGYKIRDGSEDHLAAMGWGIMALAHHEAIGAVVDGVRLATWEELDDRPRWYEEVR